jgi:hypothetical protein
MAKRKNTLSRIANGYYELRLGEFGLFDRFEITLTETEYYGPGLVTRDWFVYFPGEQHADAVCATLAEARECVYTSEQYLAAFPQSEEGDTK